jgi:hypothetical protein
MGTQNTGHTWSGDKLYLTLMLLVYLIILIFPISLRAAPSIRYCLRLSARVDTLIAESLKGQLMSHKDDLYYPNSVHAVINKMATGFYGYPHKSHFMYIAN